ncbi:MAG: hypothetical protein KGH78_05485 [Candidatus Micrarchaeota archaeon]|nr:hypothetical protein [Candidatus Micrarchaeota archaeon]
MEVGHKRVGNLVVCDSCGVFEVMPKTEQKAIVDTLLELPDESIDEFFKTAGLVYETEKQRVGFKALTPALLEDLRKNRVESQAFDTLFDERPKEAIMKSLEKILFGLRGRNRRLSIP